MRNETMAPNEVRAYWNQSPNKYRKGYRNERLDEAAQLGIEYIPFGAMVSPWLFEDKFPRLQILTIEQLLAGASVRYPRLLEATFKKAPKAKAAKAQQQLDLEGPF
jgi:hypothetical protein